MLLVFALALSVSPMCAFATTLEVGDADITYDDGTVAGDVTDSVSPGDAEALLENPLEGEEDEVDDSGFAEATPFVPVVIPDGYELYIMPSETLADETAVEPTHAPDLETFLQEPVTVDRYQYEILKKLEYLQYAQAFMVALIFILIFKKK